MKVIRSDPDLERIPNTELRQLIDQRISESTEYFSHFSELVFFVVVEPGDGLSEVESRLGFPLLRNRFDSVPFGDSAFTPSWDVIEEHESCYELVYVLGDDGSGVVVFVMKEEGTNPELLQMCRQYTNQGVHP